MLLDNVFSKFLFVRYLHFFRYFVTNTVSEKFEAVSKGTGSLTTKLFLCNINGCTHPPFKYKKARDNHRMKCHHDVTIPANGEGNDKSLKNSGEDYICNYVSASLYLNLLLRNINDAIREGDGMRLINSYRMALLYFKACGHKNYALTVLRLLFSIKLRPNSAHRLIWGRFVNTSGQKGRNISLDLHLEHLNGFLKDLLKNLRSNMNEKKC